MTRIIKERWVANKDKLRDALAERTDLNHCNYEDLVNLAFEVIYNTIDTKIVLCQECIHQKKKFHKDRRYKKGGYWIYSCELNEDSFMSHAVNGIDYEFCSSGERRKDGSTQT